MYLNDKEITSIDPGNEPGGVFWTVAIPNDSVQVDPGKGTATYQVSNLQTLDFLDFFNDALHGPSIPATLSFTVQWGGKITNRRTITTKEANELSLGFAGEFVYNSATVEWSASEPTRAGGPTTFVGDPAGASGQHSDFAVVGHERNGVFLPH